MRLFKNLILPVLLYGSESWASLSHHIQRLQKFVTRCTRIIFRISLWQKLRNTEIRKMANIERVEIMLQLRRLRWLDHIKRMSNSRLLKQLLVSRIFGGKRSQGGQVQRWHDIVNSDLKHLNLLSSWRSMAINRQKWRNEINSTLVNLNHLKEQDENFEKDCKKGNNVNNNLKCSHHGCNKVTLTKAGLANHIRQRHSNLQTVKCQFCHQCFKPQGIHNHEKKFCKKLF